MLRLIKVSGDSLSPRYREGDFVLVAKIPLLFNRLKQGDTIVFKHPNYGTMIKKVDYLDKDHDQIYVIGTHDFSVDSREFGPISKKTLIGKVIWHLHQPVPKDKIGSR